MPARDPCRALRAWPRLAVVIGVCLSPALAGYAAAAGSNAEAELKAVEKKLGAERARQQALESQASLLAGKIAELRDRLIDLAATIQQREVVFGTIEAALQSTEESYRAARAAWDRDRDRLETAVGALVRVRRAPPDALALMPGAWAESTRSALLLSAALPALDERAAKIATGVADMLALREAQQTKRAKLAEVKSELLAKRGELKRLLRRKSSLQAKVMADRRGAAAQVAALATKAKTLRELVETLATAKAHEATAAAAAARAAVAASPAAVVAPVGPLRSSLPFPVLGRIVQGFGQRLDNGAGSVGITIETRPGAQVIAPRDGRVVFSGPFRSYGQLLIIEHGRGYHSLLAGFSRIDSEVGRWVRAGEPVGVMGTRSRRGPVLYVEVRHDGQPIDPRQWLESGRRKVSG